MKHKPKHYVEYAVFRLLAGFMMLLPHRVALSIAWLLAAFGFFVVRFRVAEAKRRIEEAFDHQLEPSRVRQIAWLGFRNLCFNVIEIIRIPRLSKNWLREHVHFPTLDDVGEKQRFPSSFVLLTVHMGNWDLGARAANDLHGYQLFAIARRQSNLLMDAYLNGKRNENEVGETLLTQDNIPRQVIKRLKEGKNLAILPDVRSRTPALSIQFLGKPANLAAGAAMFGRQVGVPLIPIFGIRQGWTRHTWTLLEPVYPDPDLPKKEDTHRLTQAVMDQLTEIVRKHPENYFWFNKRWVLEPLEPTAKPSSETPHPEQPHA